jgi:hypothetical protein
MVLVGLVQCSVCGSAEGMLSEIASGHGRRGGISDWAALQYYSRGTCVSQLSGISPDMMRIMAECGCPEQSLRLFFSSLVFRLSSLLTAGDVLLFSSFLFFLLFYYYCGPAVRCDAIAWLSPPLVPLRSRTRMARRRTSRSLCGCSRLRLQAWVRCRHVVGICCMQEPMPMPMLTPMFHAPCSPCP